jgi:hypothetical protein
MPLIGRPDANTPSAITSRRPTPDRASRPRLAPTRPGRHAAAQPAQPTNPLRAGTHPRRPTRRTTTPTSSRTRPSRTSGQQPRRHDHCTATHSHRIVHAGRILTVESAGHTFRSYDGDQLLAETGRTTTKPIAPIQGPQTRTPASASPGKRIRYLALIVISRVEPGTGPCWRCSPGTGLLRSRTSWGCRRRAGTAACVQLPGPLAVGRQIGPGVARLGVGQGLLVPIRIARSWEAEHRPLPGRGPLDDLEPV